MSSPQVASFTSSAVSPPRPESHLHHALQGNRLATGLLTDEGGAVVGVRARNKANGEDEVYDADAVIFAISISG
jgi:succinate dehydrogenase/fumarate reductase flavoprotein subunit